MRNKFEWLSIGYYFVAFNLGCIAIACVAYWILINQLETEVCCLLDAVMYGVATGTSGFLFAIYLEKKRKK